LGEVEVQEGSPTAAITRIAFPFRAEFEAKKDIVRKIIDGLKNRSLYPMFADQITTPTFIDDIALAMEYFITKRPQGVFHLVASSFQSPYELALMIAEVFGFDKRLVKTGSLEKYQKGLPPGSRPWQKNLGLSNQKLTNIGVKMRNLKGALLEVKAQRRG
jgi:dTDP-4-dehydrorhamnose reductase